MKRDRTLNIKQRITPIVVLMALILTACGNTSTDKKQKTDKTSQLSSHSELVNLAEGIEKKKFTTQNPSSIHSNALTDSAINLLAKTVSLGDSPDDNYLISPLSLQMALGMLAAGTDGESVTRKELTTLLMPGIDTVPDEINMDMAVLSENMRSDPDTEWNVVNSVWINKDGHVRLSDNYISDVISCYQAELYEIPFDDSSVGTINEWVKDNTKGRIQTILDNLDPPVSLVLLNAVAFDGEWMTEIATDHIKKNKDFTNADGSISRVTMLSSMECGYLQLAGGEGFLKFYKGGRYCFMALLPPEGITIEDYLNNILSGETTLYEAIQSRDYEPLLQVEFPEFKAEYSANMNEVVQSLGANKIFDENAEFGRMITEDSERISVDLIEHKAMIEIDRKGTKAAAATAVTATEASIEEPEVINISLNRPFVYGIIDMNSGIPVFLGVQNTMP